MSPFIFISSLIDGAVGSMIVLPLMIIIGSLFSEDATSIVIGILAADGALSIPIALSSLFIGIIIGDSGIYFLGRLASSYPLLGRFVDHDFLVPFRDWIKRRFVLTVFSACFIPGTRFLTYISCGFFHTRFSVFLLTAVVSTTIWTTIIFSASYLFGSVSSGWLSHIRWGIAIVFLLSLFFVGRHNIRAYRARKTELDI